MTSHAYYNENDEFAAAWLRNLIDAGAVASGEVDTRSVVDGRQNGEQCGDYRRLGHWARHPAQSSMYGSPSSSYLVLSIIASPSRHLDRDQYVRDVSMPTTHITIGPIRFQSIVKAALARKMNPRP